MSRNGPLALAFHTLFVVFMLAPIAIVCWVAFTPTGFLSIPAPSELSLRWFAAIGRYPEFVSAFWNSLWLAALGVALAAQAGGVAWGFNLVFALVGFANAGGVLSDLNIAMEFGPEAERPTYIGLARTITGPAVFIAPLLGGWIAQTWSYPAVFAASLAFGAGGLALLIGRVREPRHAHPESNV